MICLKLDFSGEKLTASHFASHCLWPLEKAWFMMWLSPDIPEMDAQIAKLREQAAKAKGE